MNKTLIVIVIVLAVLIVGGIVVNNQIVALRESCTSAWAQVETVLQRRYDLIPNLVSTVKGYASHEKGLFEDVTRLRSQWGAAKTTAEKAEAATQLEGGLARLLLVSEQYPDLKASANFKDLQYELSGTENRITIERQRYNEAVRLFNIRVQQFPWSIFASSRGLKADVPYFESAPQAKEAPKVQF